MAFLASHSPAFKNFGYVCLKKVTLIDILVQNFTIFFSVLLRHLLVLLWRLGLPRGGVSFKEEIISNFCLKSPFL